MHYKCPACSQDMEFQKTMELHGQLLEFYQCQPCKDNFGMMLTLSVRHDVDAAEC